MNQLLVSIMTVGGKNKHHDLIIVDGVNQTVLFGNVATPLPSTVARERFWMTSANFGVIHQFIQQLPKFLKGLWLFSFQTLHVLQSPVCIIEFVHQVRGCLKIGANLLLIQSCVHAPAELAPEIRPHEQRTPHESFLWGLFFSP